jgi:hypothetical protein
LAVYSDPNNDGNPSDAHLLSSQVVTIPFANGAYHPPTFFAIPPTAVSGKFFIAGAMAGVSGDAQIVFEADDSLLTAKTGSVSQQRSWLAVDVDSPGMFNMADVLGQTNGANDLAPTLLDDLGAPGNWVLRATAEAAAVPESSYIAIVAVGLTCVAAAVTGRRAKRLDGRSAE